jgi:hypothetical protein
MDCKFSDKNWVPYLEDKKKETLVTMVQGMMKRPNEQGLTPIQKMLKSKTPPKP